MTRFTAAAIALVALFAADRVTSAQGIQIALDSGHPAHVVAPGEEGRVAIVLTNPAEKAEVTLHVEVESFDGSVVRAETALAVPSKGTTRWPLPKRLFGNFGIKWVRSWIAHGGEKSERHEVSFAYMIPAGTTDRSGGLLFGIAYGAGPDNVADRAAQRAALCGVKIARGHPVWPRIQPRPDEWDWSSCDAIIEAHARYGIETQVLLSGAPRWAWQTEGEGVPTVAAWTAFCRKLAERYRSRVRFYELWNEPDIGFFRGTQEQYIELLRTGYRAIKAGDPSAQVTTGGFASWSHGETKSGMVPRVLRECRESYDLIAYHRHGEFAGFRDELEQYLLPHRKALPGEPKPLYFTETGMDTRFGQQFQACTLPKKIAFAWAHGAVAYTWFNLHDMRAAEHPRQPGFTYGLYTRLDRIDESKPFLPGNMDYDRAWPKAVYVAYNTLTSLLTGKQYIRQYELARDQYAYVFSSDNEHVVLAWTETAGAGAHLVVATEGALAHRVDLMGNRTPWPVVDGRTVLSLTEEPSYLVLTGGGPPALEGRLIAPTAPFTAVPGRPTRLEVEVWNPTRNTVSLGAEWRIADALRAEPRGGRWTLLAGGRETLGLEVKLPRDARAGFGQVFPCAVQYRLEPVGWTGTLTLPVTMGAVLLPRGELARQPTFRLREPSQVVNLFEHDPHTVHLLWKGRQDLSADVRLARIERGLKLQLDVQDDVRFAPPADGLDQGDHTEILVHVPGQEGIWKVLVAHQDGKTPAGVTVAPRGRQHAPATIPLRTWGEGSSWHYAITLLDEDFGLSDDALRNGVRFNIRMHDHDGKGPKGWLEAAPGGTTDDAAGCRC